jgi:hypothetical protein
MSKPTISGCMPKKPFVARQSETKQVKEAPIDLARPWTQAASCREHTKEPAPVRATCLAAWSPFGIWYRRGDDAPPARMEYPNGSRDRG